MAAGTSTFTLLGVGAMSSPRYAPAGLLVEHDGVRVAVDGGPGAEPAGRVDAWLVTDDRAELMPRLRRLARSHDTEPVVGSCIIDDLAIEPRPVVHTSHPTFGYLIATANQRVVWAPEFFEFPAWASGADLLFAEAASWAHPIHFAGKVGGHASVLQVAERAVEHHVRRLVYAHIGRRTIAAIDAGLVPPFGEFGTDGAVYVVDDTGSGAEGPRDRTGRGPR